MVIHNLDDVGYPYFRKPWVEWWRDFTLPLGIAAPGRILTPESNFLVPHSPQFSPWLHVGTLRKRFFAAGTSTKPTTTLTLGCPQHVCSIHRSSATGASQITAPSPLSKATSQQSSSESTGLDSRMESCSSPCGTTAATGWWFCSWDKWEKMSPFGSSSNQCTSRQAVAVACCFVVSSGFWKVAIHRTRLLDFMQGRERLMLLQRVRPNGGPNICSWCWPFGARWEYLQIQGWTQPVNGVEEAMW